MANRLYNEPLIWRAAYIGRRLYGRPLIQGTGYMASRSYREPLRPVLYVRLFLCRPLNAGPLICRPLLS